MSSDKEIIKGLLARIDDLSKKQENISKELTYMREQLSRMTSGDVAEVKSEPEKPAVVQPEQIVTQEAKPLSAKPPAPTYRKPIIKSDFEKWIGENLISKVGIVITVIGVGFGAKYAIDNDLLSPIVRIISGYILGAALGFIALRLKKKYPAYSAVLLGGAIAIFYFITFAAYSYYSFIPRAASFVLMIGYTAGAVFAAAKYKEQSIALFGMVGAYAVPFLLSDDSGNAAGLFTYVLIINLGILIISLSQYWKWLYYGSFVFTWGIYLAWFFNTFDEPEFTTGLYFALGFFLIFYLTFLGYKLVRSDKFYLPDVFLILVNAFVFFAVGYALFDSRESPYGTGIFTLANAAAHFVVTLLIRSRSEYDIAVYRLVVGLAAVFTVLTVPIQLDGGWVTLTWIGMGAVLIHVARTRNQWFYELIAYPVIVLSFFSLMIDWWETGGSEVSPFLNVHFLISIIYTGTILYVLWLIWKTPIELSRIKGGNDLMKIVIPAIAFIAGFALFYVEISRLFDIPGITYEFQPQVYSARSVTFVLSVSTYLAGCLLINDRFLFHETFGKILQGGVLLSLFIFLTTTLEILGTFRGWFLDDQSLYYADWVYIYQRYLVFIIILPTVYLLYRSFRSKYNMISSKQLQTLILNTIGVWILSSEVIHWMDMLGYDNSYKLGLSITWGIYAVVVVIYGIKTRQKYIRLAGIGLFGITLVKLFLYDIADIPVLSKTIIFIVLGLLLLAISYSYFRFRDKISKD